MKSAPSTGGVRHIRQRVSLYVDDIIMSLSPVEEDLDVARAIFDLFAWSSGLVCNMSKCQLAPIRCNEDQVAPIRCNENPLTIFARISFYLVGNENGKVRNGIWSVKSGPSKTDKSKQKYIGIDRQMVI
jgi:hypothetical protein